MNVVDLGLERTRYAVIDETIESRWRRVTSMQHDAVAIVTPRDQITFADLEVRADAIARELDIRGPHGSCPVAVDLEPTAESVVHLLATLISGRPLVMIDPQLPDARREHILSTSGAVALHTVLEEAAATEFRFGNALEPLSSDPAMIAFTSGTSGAPKGVVLSHSMCLNKADELAAAIDLRPDDHIGNLLPVSFGAGITALIMGLMNGVTVYCWDPRVDGTSNLDHWLRKNAITTAHCAPSFLRAWTAAEPTDRRDCSDNSLRIVVTYGEAVHGRDYQQHRDHGFSDTTYINWMAATETGVVAYNAFAPGSAFPAGIVPAGRARDGKDVQIVDLEGNSLPDGEVGEIHIISSDLADGYHGDPERTAQRFTTLADGVSRYRTGDRGCIDTQGELQLRGRLDDAVKIRGYLVEPTEVDASLRAISDVVDVAVIVRTENDDPVLCAYVVSNPNRIALSPAEVRRELSQRLPGWMVPRHIIMLTSIPRTERGKINRAALPAPAPVTTTTAGPTLETITEFRIAIIWSKIIGLESLDRDDDFFALGGDSLAAAEMLTAVRAAVLVTVTGAQFATATTIRELAALVDAMLCNKKRDAGRASDLVPLATEGSRTPLFLITGAGAPALSFLAMTQAMSGNRPVYALQAHGMESRGLPDRTVSKMADRYIREIRKVQQHGPYVLGGYSHGGFVALEIASRLHDEGETVEQVVILDTHLRENMIAPNPDAALETSSEIKSPEPVLNARARTSRKSVLGIWFRYQFAGVMQFDTSMQWYLFYHRGLASLRNYVPRPYRGAVTVIRGEDNRQSAADWSTVATGHITFQDILGSHEDILRAPYAVATGEAVERALSSIRGNPRLNLPRQA
ncbi:alpha/beta fold hydrolase [Rhodococcus sp. ARC_M6]|uniref:alpha/beta fold hydrolase n=1 Tax=Rhodococcus sp. ARC_M6 TaxID=2928852 RepID=UPI001FB2D73E|nr:alpha/beta fold hydrolase [Rhodococcus sp. ARC_M6]MCJ0903469.1 alpha/beta fold hydrolase [Rhodococcus sp. ARC_M6]